MSSNNLNLVTIGIPFYNGEKYLQDAILSVINQTYSNWNLILVDDGSTDKSLEIAKSFESDSRVSIVSDGKNRGLVYRLNQIIDLANGTYFARMDADDIMHFQRIEKQVAFLQNNPEIDVVGASYYAIDNNNSVLGIRISNPEPKNTTDILKNGCFAHPSVMGKTVWFKNYKYDAEWERMEDLELWLRTLSHSKFRNIEEPLLFYRVFGIPLFTKYIKSNLGIIKLLRNRKKYSISFYQSIYFILFFLLKIVIYSFFNFIGKVHVLLKNRFTMLNGIDNRDAVVNLLKSIER